MTEAREAIELRIAQAIDHSEIVADTRLYYGIGASKWVAARRVFTALSEAGWVVVPREPTEAMIEAGNDVLPFARGTETHAMAGGITPEDIYSAMISAATPPAKGGE